MSVRLSAVEVPIWPQQVSIRKWFVLIGLAVTSIVWLEVDGCHLVMRPIVSSLFMACFVFTIGWTTLLARGNVGVFIVADTVAFVISFAIAGCILSYLTIGASSSFPLIDPHLALIDKSLGFDWPRYFSWVVAHPALNSVLNHAYICWSPEWVVLPALLAYRHDERVRELLALGVIATCAMLPLTAFFPAISPFPYYFPSQGMGLDWVRDITALRDGTIVLNFADMTGLVSIPSFHTIGAAFFIYVSRNIRFLFPVSLALNAIIILSTLTSGSHYLIDVITGLMFAAITILAYRRYKFVEHGVKRR